MRYGKELILDLNRCDVTKFSRTGIKLYFSGLCELIDMIPENLYFWDDLGIPIGKRQTEPETKGTSAIQFILTSNITIHTLDLMGAVFINVFSCKEFDIKLAKEFSIRYFRAKECIAKTIDRGDF